VGFNPPRCGGLLCNAPKGAEEKLAILAGHPVDGFGISGKVYENFLSFFLVSVRSGSEKRIINNNNRPPNLPFPKRRPII
jgi:hypothetical protein